MCTFEDLEWMEDVISLWTIDKDGEPVNERATIGGDFAGYTCNDCGEQFTNQDSEEAFKEAKEHLRVEAKL